jgi:hypothetical protein
MAPVYFASCGISPVIRTQPLGKVTRYRYGACKNL